jgi:hypothetical protein
VHPYTLRRDALPHGFPTLESLLGTLLDLGIDGVFTDFPDLAVGGGGGGGGGPPPPSEWLLSSGALQWLD